MKEYVTEWDFINRFDRMDRGDQFSVEARKALFTYLEELEESTGEPIEFDCIALCCDFSEHESAVKACEDLGYDLPTPEVELDEDGDAIEPDEDEREEAALEILRNERQVIEFDGGIIVGS